MAGKAADIIADAAGGSSAAAEKTNQYEWQAFHCAKVGKIIFLNDSRKSFSILASSINIRNSSIVNQKS
ncbi:MAG: hypothetical protein RBR47_14445 [Bacteroidales bacterium]|nr:hypothetical protein [Bacteroidales bacterium]MDY0336150.1 hypothetical protein [Bacteroidales bacterium]NCU37038.1 hypothetical protein [Candidatus Falkowbacteria bacterium]